LFRGYVDIWNEYYRPLMQVDKRAYSTNASTDEQENGFRCAWLKTI